MAKVAVVDDCPINRRLIKRLLAKLLQNAVEIDEWDNGEKCVKAACETDYLFILMDIDMPVMNGLAATMHIRFPDKHGFPVRRHNTGIPIVAVTSNALPLHVEMCFRIGIDYVVQKPATTISLTTALDLVGISCLLKNITMNQSNLSDLRLRCSQPNTKCHRCATGSWYSRAYQPPEPHSIGIATFNDSRNIDVNHLIKLCLLSKKDKEHHLFFPLLSSDSSVTTDLTSSNTAIIFAPAVDEMTIPTSSILTDIVSNPSTTLSVQVISSSPFVATLPITPVIPEVDVVSPLFTHDIVQQYQHPLPSPLPLSLQDTNDDIIIEAHDDKWRRNLETNACNVETLFFKPHRHLITSTPSITTQLHTSLFSLEQHETRSSTALEITGIYARNDDVSLALPSSPSTSIVSFGMTTTNGSPSTSFMTTTAVSSRFHNINSSKLKRKHHYTIYPVTEFTSSDDDDNNNNNNSTRVSKIKRSLVE